MRSWSIPAGHIFGAEVRIHVSFAFLLLFIWMTEGNALSTDGVERGVALTALVLASVLLHEAGHRLAGMQQNRRAGPVLLFPIGGVSLPQEPERENTAARGEWGFALAGPVTNLLAAFVAAGIVVAVTPGISLFERPLVLTANLPRSFVWVNLFLVAINLLPAYPADAGRMVRALLARRMDEVAATRRAVSISQGVAMLLILSGIWSTWAMLAGFFLFLAAQVEDRSAVFHSVLRHVHLHEVMLTDFSTLSPADTLEDALHKAVHTLQDDFPVVRGSDMVGVVSRQKIVEALRSGGNGYVQSVMNRAFSVAQAEDTLASAFRKITAKGGSALPVVDAGRLVGIVTLQNLMHSMALLAESKRLRQKAD
jgi:CBS domain-containing protein/Zn-dependent protease